MADQAKRIPVAKEGLPFILFGGLLTFGGFMMGWTWLTCLVGSGTLFTTWFFRNPSRTIPQGDSLIVSPGDGTVVAVEQEFEHRYLKEPSIRISIFLNVFDVHINRMPVSGVLQDMVYQPGQYMRANLPGASTGNEQNALMLRRSDEPGFFVCKLRVCLRGESSRGWCRENKLPKVNGLGSFDLALGWMCIFRTRVPFG